MAQDTMSVEDLLKTKYGEDYRKNWNSEEKSSWHDVEEVVFKCSDYILNTPDDYKNSDRNKMMQFVFLWVKKGEYDLPYNDKFAKEIRDINQMLWAHYLVCLSNAYLTDTSRSADEIKVYATKCLLRFVDNKSNISKNSSLSSNRIIESIKLNELRVARNERKIKRIISR